MILVTKPFACLVALLPSVFCFVDLKVNFMLFLSGVPDFHLRPVLNCVTTRYPTRYHKFI